MPFDAPPIQPVLLPEHLPASCFSQPAQDYQVPEMVLVAMIKVESGGRSVVSKNTNGTKDIGVAQHNTASWVPYLKTRYGINPDLLIANPCQSIRAAAYVLRTEMNHKRCAGVNIWCAVSRYHSPNNASLGYGYAMRVSNSMVKIMNEGKF